MSLKPWHVILLFVFIFFVSIGIAGYTFVKRLTPEEIFDFPVVKEVLRQKAGDDKKELVDLLPTFLGFEKPQTYLILFGNNTEMRPGGGFIGTYATVRVEDGKIDTLAIEGTEVLDKRTPATWKPTPPKIVQEKLGVDRWYFRDSNWSPDFAQSSKKSLEFYTAEGGVAAEDIDAVVAITPTVLEELLRITGPITIQGIEFNAQTAVRTLEHEVEYGFKDKGIAVIDRKQIIEPFFHTLLRKIMPDALLHTQKYIHLFDTMAQEKQVTMYFLDEKIQNTMKQKNWTGEVLPSSGDYLLWVDANLGALKTDEAMKRELSYTVAPGEGESLVAKTKMKYIHIGVFDKFTTRYLTYARVYVPAGAVLKEVNATKAGQKTLLTTVDQGQELGKQWFDVYFVVEPQQTRELEFVYIVPKNVQTQIKDGKYSLLTQKQVALENLALTLNLNFGTNIQSATPAEEQKEWGDGVYRMHRELKSDQQFDIQL